METSGRITQADWRRTYPAVLKILDLVLGRKDSQRDRPTVAPRLRPPLRRDSSPITSGKGVAIQTALSALMTYA